MVNSRTEPLRVTAISEISKITGTPIIPSGHSRVERAFGRIVERHQQPDNWRGADRATENVEGFTGKVLTNGRVVRRQAAQRVDTLVFLLFESTDEISGNDLALATYREAGSGGLASPVVSQIGGSVLLEGTYISEGISLHALTRYHLDNDRRTISQITVTTASRSEVDSVTRDWLIALDTPNDEVPGS